MPAGKGLDVSNDGKTSERNISPEAQKSIQALNSASVEIANQISLNVVNDAKGWKSSNYKPARQIK